MRYHRSRSILHFSGYIYAAALIMALLWMYYIIKQVQLPNTQRYSSVISAIAEFQFEGKTDKLAESLGSMLKFSSSVEMKPHVKVMSGALDILLNREVFFPPLVQSKMEKVCSLLFFGWFLNNAAQKPEAKFDFPGLRSSLTL